MPREDSDDLRHFDAAVYSRVDDIDPTLAISWRGRFLDHFFATSGLSEHRRQEATEMLKLDRGLAADVTLLLRVEFPFMGSTEWSEWDGSAEEALQIAEDMGSRQGAVVGYDQAHGPTGWEVEFDDD